MIYVYFFFAKLFLPNCNFKIASLFDDLCDVEKGGSRFDTKTGIDSALVEWYELKALMALSPLLHHEADARSTKSVIEQFAFMDSLAIEEYINNGLDFRTAVSEDTSHM